MRPFDVMSSSPQPQLLITRQYIARQIWEYISNYILSSLTPRFHDKNISTKIKAKFGLDLYPWQVSMVANITYYKKDVFVIIGTNARKSLIYQSLPEIIGCIVLAISPTIAFMEDQTQWLY